jgi:hypothetical protein
MPHCRNQMPVPQHAPARVPWSITIFSTLNIRRKSDTSPAEVRRLIRRMSDTYRGGMIRKSPLPAAALAAIGQASGRGRGKRSPLYLWFREHHDELATGFARSAPAWQPLATFLGEQGVLDADGKPPTARAARDAWWRVRQDLKQAAALPTTPTASEAVGMPTSVREVVQPPALPSAAPTPLPAPLQPLADTRPRMPPLKPRKT